MTARFTASEVVLAAGAELLVRGRRDVFAGVSTDSRTIAPGSLFVALKGERFDAHDFLVEAAAKGAAGAVVRRGTALPPPGSARGFALFEVDDTLAALGALARLHRERFAIPLGAVAGSNGKTTTKEMAAAILLTGGETLATEGNLNNEVGVPLTLLRLEPTHRAAVVEVGMSSPGELARLTAMARPTAGLVTLVAEEHLAFLKDLDGVAEAEGELYRGLPEEATTVVNADDPRCVAQAARSPARRRVTFGCAAGADVRLVWVVSAGAAGQRLAIEAGGTVHEAAIAFVGEHNARNATAAFALAWAMGFSAEACVAGLSAARPFAHRSRLLQAGGVAILDDCYNANPSSMAAALAALGTLATEGQRVAVLGDMLELGEAEVPEHRSLGRLAAVSADRVAFFGPRSREAFEAARRAGLSAEAAAHFEEIASLLSWLFPRLHPGDTLLVKGSRGMRLERVVDGVIAGPAGPDVRGPA